MLLEGLTCLQKGLCCVRAPTTRLQSYKHRLYGYNASSPLASV